jgi:hypothetical protein
MNGSFLVVGQETLSIKKQCIIARKCSWALIDLDSSNEGSCSTSPWRSSDEEARQESTLGPGGGSITLAWRLNGLCSRLLASRRRRGSSGRLRHLEWHLFTLAGLARPRRDAQHSRHCAESIRYPWRNATAQLTFLLGIELRTSRNRPLIVKFSYSQISTSEKRSAT